MRLDIRPRACLLCREAQPDSWEHIIPEFIGGRLQAPILCTSCNSAMGSSLVAQLKRDPAIRIAAEQIALQIPDLYKAMKERWQWVAPGPDGEPVRIKGGKAGDRIIARQTPQGDLLVDASDAPQRIKETLAKERVPPHEIAAHLNRLGSARADEVTVFPTGIRAILRPVESLQPDLSHPLVDDRLFSLIAVEYLFLVIGEAVLRDYFDPVASYICGDGRPGYVTIERLRSGRYAAQHRIYLLPEPQRLQVYVWCFGYLVYRVTFDRLGNNLVDAPVYVEDLKAKLSLWATSLANARKGEFISLQA